MRDKLSRTVGILMLLSGGASFHTSISEYLRLKNDYLDRQTAITPEVRREAYDHVEKIFDNFTFNNTIYLSAAGLGAYLAFGPQKKKENN